MVSLNTGLPSLGKGLSMNNLGKATATVLIGGAMAFVGYTVGNLLLGVILQNFPALTPFADWVLLALGVVGALISFPIAGGLVTAVAAGLAASAGQRVASKYLSPVVMTVMPEVA